jgi:hypothetical protein
MIRHHEQIDRAYPIDRAHQVELLVGRQVAQIEKTKPAKRNMNPDGLEVLRVVNSRPVGS